METQERLHHILLQKISSGATLIENTDEVVLMDELISRGYATGAESTAFGERHFLDVNITPTGKALLAHLKTRWNS